MKRILLFYCLSLGVPGIAQTGKNGSYTVTQANQILNQYTPLTANIQAGTSSISYLQLPSLSFCPGDLIMLYEAQGGGCVNNNSANYGDINAYNQAGVYEFAYIQSINGSNITVQVPLSNAFSTAGHAQLIKVPQYTTLSINQGCSIQAKPWKDTIIASVLYRFGGVLAVHALSIDNNGVISASGSGFRGGQVQAMVPYTTGITDYVSGLSINGGEKGEGICGDATDYDLNGGRYCRGAAANGGGGGTSTNASGGGGANGFNGNTWTGQGVMISDNLNPLAAWMLDPGYAANGNALTTSSGGGRGGYSWGNTNGNALVNGPGDNIWQGDRRRETGGLGGRPLMNIDAERRVYFGGGGGAGDANNDGGTSGGNGGGIVYLIATSNITGSGKIESDGASVPFTQNCNCDGSGGGGAGGSIIVKSPLVSNTQTFSCRGGTGGGQNPVTPPGFVTESEGPGGGGGGGFIALTSLFAGADVDGGMNGSSMSPGVSEFPFNGGTKGAPGNTAVVSNTFISHAVQTTTLNPVCFGGTIFLSSSASGGITYLWNGPNGFVSSAVSPQIPNASAAMAGTYTLNVQYANGCHQISKVVVNLKECTKTGISEIKKSETTFFPNPVISGRFTVLAGESIELMVLDASGKIVYETKLPEGKNEVDAGSLNAGLYIVKFHSKDRINFAKLIIMDK